MTDEHEEHLRLHKQAYSVTLPAETLFPEYHRNLFRQALEDHMNLLRFGHEWARKSHHVEHPNPDYEARSVAQQAFAERWYALIEEGEREGFLGCGPDGDYFIEEVPKLVYETVYDETEEEWEARKATLPETVEFKVLSRKNEGLE